jgi:hypothetical protein
MIQSILREVDEFLYGPCKKHAAATSSSVATDIVTEPPNSPETQTAGQFFQVPFDFEAIEEKGDTSCEQS